MDSSEFWEGGTHNSLLTPVAELGILVGGIYLLLVGRVFLSGLRFLRSKRPRTADQIALVTCATLVAIVFVINASLVELRFTLTPNALFWVSAAFIERASRHQPHNSVGVLWSDTCRETKFGYSSHRRAMVPGSAHPDAD